MERQFFVYQQVLRYAVYFPAEESTAAINAVESKYPSIRGSKIETGDSDIYFTYDSDRKPVYAMIFVEKLTKSTDKSDTPDCLAINFNESDLTAWRNNYPAATAIILDIYGILRENAQGVRPRVGWLAHMCSWREAEIPRHSTRSAVADGKEPADKGVERTQKCATVPHRRQVNHAHKYSLTGKGGTIKQVKK